MTLFNLLKKLNRYTVNRQNTTIYIMQSTNNQTNMDDTRDGDGPDDFSQCYRNSKTITILLYSHVIEIISILCVILCIILLLLCTLILTVSLYLTEIVKNNYNKHNLPDLKNIIDLYIGTVSEEISNYITLSKLMASSNTIIKQESSLSGNNIDNSRNGEEIDHDNEDEYTDTQSIPSTDTTIDNSINANELINHESSSNENSDIEDITDEVLQRRLLNRDVVDLTNDMDTTSDIMNEPLNEEDDDLSFPDCIYQEELQQHDAMSDEHVIKHHDGVEVEPVEEQFDLFAELARNSRRLSRVMEPFTPNPHSKLSEKEQYYSFYTGDVDTTIVDEEEQEQEQEQEDEYEVETKKNN